MPIAACSVAARSLTACAGPSQIDRVLALAGGRLALNATAGQLLRAASTLSWFRNTVMVFDAVVRK
jgi:hypothetical protein